MPQGQEIQPKDSKLIAQSEILELEDHSGSKDPSQAAL